MFTPRKPPSTPQSRNLPKECFRLAFLDTAILKANENFRIHNSPTQPNTPSFNDPPILQPGDVIEFYGPACSGKTTILYHTILTTILPPRWTRSNEADNASIDLCGRGKGVIFFDLDGKFKIQRLYSMILHYLIQRVSNTVKEKKGQYRLVPPLHKQDEKMDTSNVGSTSATSDVNLDWIPSEDEIKMIAKSALHKLHIFEPTISESFYATLLTLPEYMMGCTQDEGYEFSFLMIDSINSFYWQDKVEEGDQSADGDKWKQKNSYYYVQALRQIIQVTKIIVVATNGVSMKTNVVQSLPSELCYTNIAPLAWQSFVKYRFALAKQPLLQYLISPQEAVDMEEIKRKEFISQPWFYGRLVTPVYNNIHNIEEIFQFRIGEGGLSANNLVSP
ncbi:4167_t:CDS:2 [Acaulospora morrowiae]|uniref:4167_t:CDS:1 n=1 Tax=Acaulospora morrowiae TaxID=94023 RepID=A0A9N9ASI9_9GLOM|nr:4167_t:CDS:2 [Acaulospora morrowiae]